MIVEISYVTSEHGFFYVLWNGKPAWAAITSAEDARTGTLLAEQSRIAGIMRNAERSRGYRNP